MLSALIPLACGQPYPWCSHWVSPSLRLSLVIPNSRAMTQASSISPNQLSLLTSKAKSSPLTHRPLSNLMWVMLPWSVEPTVNVHDHGLVSIVSPYMLCVHWIHAIELVSSRNPSSNPLNSSVLTLMTRSQAQSHLAVLLTPSTINLIMLSHLQSSHPPLTIASESTDSVESIRVSLDPSTNWHDMYNLVLSLIH